MSNTRKFMISSDIWGGYTIFININQYRTIQEIVNHFKEQLKDMITTHNLTEQLHDFQHRHNKFHIHNFTYNDILNSASDTIFFVCDHC
jgi:hypothetical protein